MDITTITVVGVLILGGLYFYFKGRREGTFSVSKKRAAAKSPDITTMSGQFSSGQWGELEGARRHS